MGGPTLRKLFSKKKTAELLRGLLEEQSKKGPIAILDADRVLILGEVPSVPEQTPIMAEGEIIGWIAGIPTPSLALLISHLFLSERDKRVLLKEALVKYRELNLLYGLSEKLDVCPDCSEISRLILNEALRALIADGAEVLLLNTLALQAASAIERKLVEARLIDARLAAEAADRAKSQFLANMSHEIRTPMNGILGMMELVLETEMTSEQKNGLEIVRESANHLLSIIEAVLDLSRLEGNKLKLRPGEFSLCRIADLLAVGAHRKGLTFFLDLPLGIPDPLVGDAGCLRQIVVNLVENAIKFTEEGEISLSVKVESQSPAGVFLVFSVSDTDCGIPAEKLAAVFEPFVQSDSSFTRRHGGMGLGLSIAKQLAEMMGGSISGESAPGHGSTFRLGVPFGITTISSPILPVIEKPDRSKGPTHHPFGGEQRRQPKDGLASSRKAGTSRDRG
ncbi:MAG TPA: ATP-binding protein, partial [Chroococcales cyanobacterium]